MQTFYKETKLTTFRDSQVKESMETKLEKQTYIDVQPLTPELFLMPLRDQSIILKDCFTKKAEPDDPALWKLVNAENFWLLISDIYFQAPDNLNLQQIRSLREHTIPATHKGQKKQHKIYHVNPQKAEVQDKIFVCQSRILALKKGIKQNCSIDQLIDLWEEDFQIINNKVDLQVARLEMSIDECRLQAENLNHLLSPAVYRSDLVHFEYMELEDIQARKCQQEIQRKINSKIVCCVCNLEEFEDHILIECKKCKSIIHDKCYLMDTKISQNKDDFICWSCSTPDLINYNGQKCCLCSQEGGILGPSDMMSNHQYVINNFHPLFIFSIQQVNESEFQMQKQTILPPDIHEFKTRVHLNCAFWHSECYYNRQTKQFEGFLKIKDKKWKIPCKICRKINGAVIDCDYQGCSKVYHVECARRAKMYMSLIRIGKLSKQTFCEKHRIKYSYEKIYEKRLETLSTLRKLYAGVQKILGQQGLLEHKSKKSVLKLSKARRKQLQLFCICRKPDIGEAMIQCERCFQWYHFKCVKIQNVNSFVCGNCQKRF